MKQFKDALNDFNKAEELGTNSVSLREVIRKGKQKAQDSIPSSNIKIKEEE